MLQDFARPTFASSGEGSEQKITATSFMVLGAGCKMLLILIGIVAFGDLSRPGAVLGGLASLLGCIAYAQIQRAASSSNAPIKGPAPLPWSLFVTYAVVMTAMIASITDPAVSAGARSAWHAKVSPRHAQPEAAATTRGVGRRAGGAGGGAVHNPKLLAFAPPAPPAKPVYRPRGLPWREKSGGTALPGYPEDESIDEAKRRRKWLLHNETGIALSMNIGKAIANKKGATRIDSAPDIWYAYQPAHGRSCADAEMVNGVWTCGIRRLQCGCVIYSISHKDHTFADEIEALTPCRVYRFGPVENSVWSGTLAT